MESSRWKERKWKLVQFFTLTYAASKCYPLFICQYNMALTFPMIEFFLVKNVDICQWADITPTLYLFSYPIYIIADNAKVIHILISYSSLKPLWLFHVTPRKHSFNLTDFKEEEAKPLKLGTSKSVGDICWYWEKQKSLLAENPCKLVCLVL